MKSRIDTIIICLKKKGYENIVKLNSGNPGRFSDVFKVTKKSETHVMKVQKKDTRKNKQDSLFKLFSDEISLLTTLNPGHPNVIKYIENFTLKLPKPYNEEIYCIELDAMDTDLYFALETYFKYGMPINIVKNITKQLLEGLAYIHKYEIIHTDLKPENILVKKVSTDSFQVCIGDLGNGCLTSNHFTSNVGTTEYRAPENIINAEYNEKMDIWAIACIVFELLTGDYLFDPHSYLDTCDGSDEDSGSEDGSDSNTIEISSQTSSEDGSSQESDDDLHLIVDHIHLYLIHKTLGKIPKYIARQGKYFKDFYMDAGNLRKINIEVEREQLNISQMLVIEYNFSKSDADACEEFLLPMLNYDKDKRVTAEEHAKHKWLTE